MKMKIQCLIYLTFILLVLTSSFVSPTAEEYLYEFNNNGEICEIVDYFYYDLKCPIIFNSDRLCTTVPIFYTCCDDDDDDCKTIIFDIQNKEFLNDQRNSELIDLNYIKYNLRNGNFSLIQFDLSGFDVCSFFGKKELKKESLNLAASAAEKMAPLLEAERARRIKDTVNTAKRIGKVSVFNPVDFAVSGTCIYDDKRLTEAITSISNCNTYLQNINNNYATEGYVSHFTEEIAIAEYKLKTYIDLTSAKIRGAVNSAGNFMVGFFNFFKNLASGENKEFEMKKSEYDYAEEAHAAISGYSPHLNNPKNNIILQNHNIRVSEKMGGYNTEYEIYDNYLSTIKKLKPNIFKVFFSNIFLEPNYNLSLAEDYFKKSKKSKVDAESLVKIYKLNSATEKLSEANMLINQSIVFYSNDVAIKRKFSL